MKSRIIYTRHDIKTYKTPTVNNNTVKQVEHSFYFVVTGTYRHIMRNRYIQN